MPWSTMAAAFLAEGHQVLCDDVTPIAWQGEQACCHPGPGRLKLWPDTVAALRLGARVRRPIYHEHPKLVVDAVSGLTSPLPIAHLYQLVASQDGRLAHEPLGGAESVPLLYTNIFGHRRPSARARATHFAQTTRLAYSGLLSLVHLPRALERLPEVVRFLAAT